MSLRIEIDGNRIEIQHGESCADIQRSGRFTDAAFLIEYCDDRHDGSVGHAPDPTQNTRQRPRTAPETAAENVP